MESQRAWLDRVRGDRVGDQLLGQFGGFPWGDHPTDHIAADEVKGQDRWKPVHWAGPLSWVMSPLQS